MIRPATTSSPEASYSAPITRTRPRATYVGLSNSPHWQTARAQRQLYVVKSAICAAASSYPRKLGGWPAGNNYGRCPELRTYHGILDDLFGRHRGLAAGDGAAAGEGEFFALHEHVVGAGAL